MRFRAKVLLSVWFVAVSLQGCQSSTGNASRAVAISIATDANQGLVIPCDQVLLSNPAQLQMHGPSTMQMSLPAIYSVNCAPSQAKVIWRGLSVSEDSASGVQLASVYQQPGKYVIAAQIQSQADGSSVVLSQQTVVAGSRPAISGPEVAMVGENVTFQLVLPKDYHFSSVTWDFNDGSPVVTQTSNAEVVHQGTIQGLYRVQATVTDAANVSVILNQNLNVIAAGEDFKCAGQVALSSPSEAVAGTAVGMSIFVPSCLSQTITSVKWDFGDGKWAGTNTNVQHSYLTKGQSIVQVQVFSNFVMGGPWLVLTAPVDVTSNNPSSCPADQKNRRSLLMQAPARPSPDGIQRIIGPSLNSSQGMARAIYDSPPAVPAGK